MEEGSTETWYVLAPYNDGGIHMGDISNEITNELYK